MKKILVVLFALLSAQAFGQAYSSTVLQNSPGNYGRPVPYPQVLVCIAGDTNVPCVTRATTYSDDTLTTQCTQTGSSGLLIGNPTSGANCDNPGIGDVNGNFTIYVAGGEYMICTYSGTWLCQKQTIGGGNSGSGIVNSCIGAHCDAFYPLANVPSIFGDPLATDDGAGNKTGKTFTTTQTGIAGFHYFTQGTAPVLSVNNSIYFYAPVSVSTYAWVLPGSAGSGCMQASNAGGLVTISFTGVNCGSGSGTTVQVNGTNIATQSPVNFQNSPTVSFSNPGVGNIQAAIVGAGQLANPTAPTVTATGTTGATNYCYLIVGYEGSDSRQTNGIFSSAATTTTCISNGNATLSSSNYNALTSYISSTYGYRGAIVCRTTGGATQGVITGTAAIPLPAGKAFNDTGLSADGSNCATLYAVNNTITYDACLGSSLPGNPSVPGAPCGVDGPPLVPTLFDDEMTQTFGAPGDVNDPFWTWGNQNSATAAWSNGTIIFTPDTTNQYEYLILNTALPTPPFTFEIWVDMEAFPTSASGNACFIGLRESSTSKIHDLELTTTQAVGTTSPSGANGGQSVIARNATSNSPPSPTKWQAFDSNSAYLKLQDASSNVIDTVSHTGNGVGFTQILTQALTTPFTTAPNQLIIGGIGAGGGPTTCVFDFERRTQ